MVDERVADMMWNDDGVKDADELMLDMDVEEHLHRRVGIVVKGFQALSSVDVP